LEKWEKHNDSPTKAIVPYKHNKLLNNAGILSYAKLFTGLDTFQDQTICQAID
jgi:hypothetical protein